MPAPRRLLPLLAALAVAFAAADATDAEAPTFALASLERTTELFFSDDFTDSSLAQWALGPNEGNYSTLATGVDEDDEPILSLEKRAGYEASFDGLYWTTAETMLPTVVSYSARASATDTLAGTVAVGEGSRDSDAVFHLSFGSNGYLQAFVSQYVALVEYEADTWYDIQAVLDWNNRLVTYFVDGVAVEELAFACGSCTKVSDVYLFSYGAGSAVDIKDLQLSGLKSVTVSMATASAGAEIHYNATGGTATCGTETVDTEVTLTESAQVSAVACGSDAAAYNASAAATSPHYFLTAGAVSFSTVSGATVQEDELIVVLATPEGDSATTSIKYISGDGTQDAPECADETLEAYGSEVVITLVENTVIRAVACEEGREDSVVVTSPEYEVQMPQPKVSSASNFNLGKVTVDVTLATSHFTGADDGVSMYYTLGDGTQDPPGCSADDDDDELAAVGSISGASGSIELTQSLSIMIRACRSGNTPSDVATRHYSVMDEYYFVMLGLLFLFTAFCIVYSLASTANTRTGKAVKACCGPFCHCCGDFWGTFCKFIAPYVRACTAAVGRATAACAAASGRAAAAGARAAGAAAAESARAAAERVQEMRAARAAEAGEGEAEDGGDGEAEEEEDEGGDEETGLVKESS